MNRIFLWLGALVALHGLGAAEGPEAEGYRKEIAIRPLLRTTVDAAGQPIAYPATAHPQVTAVQVRIPPGAETGWHKHPYPCFGYILSGTLTVEMEGGKTLTLTPGQALAESVNVLHNGVNRGDEPVELVMFVMGEQDKPFTIKAAP